ncbi:nicotinamide-nucleotide amidase [Pseudobutyrivibrio sp. NOR37]|uniref:CinA family protein n=1 Tax=Pseudobutyrivibrio xylanivorans TaxID=185007 RepID=A0A6M0LEV4_PSEXY|nr:MULTISPECIES: CinA family protein [Pseudobutyrivibrio]NEX01115.1 CinA family protein [Pseudobutyrivibrio xylanivorans]SFR65109.1 nicotinamide-nucleotide amidase [Pseudobutyrivibrio sp. NOR37]
MDASVIVDRLASMKMTVATAESCTGGLIASSIVDIAGASDCFNEGYITYSNEAKMRNLSVKESTLMQYGAVSTQTAKEMAMGVRKKAHADFGIASTGIAGPGGGSPEKPVGLVYIACAYDDKCQVRQLNLSGDRSQVRHQAADEALQLLSDCMDEIG